MRTALVAIVGFAFIAMIAAIFLGTAPDMASSAASIESMYGNAGTIPVSLPPLW
jgi:hypothetical protein